MPKSAIILFAFAVLCYATMLFNVLWFPVFEAVGYADKTGWNAALKLAGALGGTSTITAALLCVAHALRSQNKTPEA